MTQRRSGLASFWVTHLAKVLVGEQPCVLAPWLAGHFVLAKRDTDSVELATWKMRHTALLKRSADDLSANGWTCALEQFFRVQGSTAVVSGKTDLIVRKANERSIIIDAKSGYAKESDVAQVCIEMLLLPMAWGSPSLTFAGRVVYQDASPVEISPADAEAYRKPLFALIKQLATGPQPQAQPSESMCRYCPITDDDCPDRWKPVNTPVFTAEF